MAQILTIRHPFYLGYPHGNAWFAVRFVEEIVGPWEVRGSVRNRWASCLRGSVLLRPSVPSPGKAHRDKKRKAVLSPDGGTLRWCVANGNPDHFHSNFARFAHRFRRKNARPSTFFYSFARKDLHACAPRLCWSFSMKLRTFVPL